MIQKPQIGAAYRRHVVVDNPNKCIRIQIMFDLAGNPRQREIQQMKNGQWFHLVPDDFRGQLVNAVKNGYTVEAFYSVDSRQNEDFYFFQISDIKIEDFLK